MLAQTSVKSKSLATRSYVPPLWLDEYEQLAQPSGGVQIHLDRNFFYDRAKAAVLEVHDAASAWPMPLLKSNPAFTVISVWLGVLVWALSFPNENSAFTENIQGPWFQAFQIGKQSVDSSGTQIWQNNAFFDGRISAPSNELLTYKGKRETSPTIEEIQNFIVEIFSLAGLDDLAKLCGISRQTLYTWRKSNSRPDKENIRRFYVLWDAARNWKAAGFPAPAARLREPVLKSRSLFDYLSDRDVDIDAIKFIGHRLLITDLR